MTAVNSGRLGMGLYAVFLIGAALWLGWCAVQLKREERR